MTDKRPRGRPLTGEAREHAVNLRLSTDERDVITRAAGGVAVSTWIRERAVEAALRNNEKAPPR